MERRRFVQTVPLIERLAEEAQRIREEAKKLRPGKERKEMLKDRRSQRCDAHPAWSATANAPGAIKGGPAPRLRNTGQR